MLKHWWRDTKTAESYASAPGLGRWIKRRIVGKVRIVETDTVCVHNTYSLCMCCRISTRSEVTLSFLNSSPSGN